MHFVSEHKSRILFTASMLLLAVVAFAQGVDPHYVEPTNFNDAAADAVFATKLFQSKYWVGFALVVTQLIVFTVKRIEAASEHFKKYGTIVVLGLSAVAALLTLVVGGQSWVSALIVFTTSIAPKVIADVLTELGVTPHRDTAGDATILKLG